VQSLVHVWAQSLVQVAAQSFEHSPVKAEEKSLDKTLVKAFQQNRKLFLSSSPPLPRVACEKPEEFARQMAPASGWV